jgi:vitamin B12 transporter
VEQTFAEGAATVELTWFANRFRDIISTRTLSFNPFRSQYFNIGLTRARGVEMAAELRKLSPVKVRGGYTYLASRVLASSSPDDAVFGEGRPLFRRPRHSGFMDVTTDKGPVAVTLIGTFVGRTADSDFSALDPAMSFNDGHKRWDLRAGYALSRRLRVLAAVDNLFDNRYMEPLGYPVLGRGARAGLHVAF